MKEIKSEILSIVSLSCKAYKVQLDAKIIEYGDTILYRNNKYKVTKVDINRGLMAFKILSKGLSKTQYIKIDNALNLITEHTIKNRENK